MKIVRVSLWRVALKSHSAYYMAGGKTCDSVDTIVLRADTDADIRGWGEVCCIPRYLPAYSGGVAPALAELSPLFLGANPLAPEALMDAMDRRLPGHGYAKSPLDIALWDITARAAGVPLHSLLGGLRAENLPLYHSITCVAPEEMAKIAAEEKRKGVMQFQVKLGADDEADIARLRLVREAVGDGPLVYGDWNCGASRLSATRVGKAVADSDIMLEQPCNSLEECAAVRAATGLPMKIDENAHDTASLLKAYSLGCMDAVALKISKFGGLGALRRARDLCLHLGAQMCMEDCWGGDIATAAALHLAAATPPRAVMNVCDLSGYVSPRLDSSAPSRENGRISPPRGIGLGISPNADILGDPFVVWE